MSPTFFRDAIRDTGLSLAEIHRRSGVSLNTLRSLNSGRNRNPQRRTRLKLAAFFRQHSQTLASLADQLEAGDE